MTKIIRLLALMICLHPSVETYLSRSKSAGASPEQQHQPENQLDGDEGKAPTRGSTKGSVHTVNDMPPSGHTLEEIAGLEHSCFESVNQQRTASGLPELSLSNDLLPVARDYSKRMAEEGFFSHVDSAGLSVRERVRRAGISWKVIGENLSYSTGYVNPVAASIRGWMYSEGHRRNILDPRYTTAAVGAWINEGGTVYFTEIFLRDWK